MGSRNTHTEERIQSGIRQGHPTTFAGTHYHYSMLHTCPLAIHDISCVCSARKSTMQTRRMAIYGTGNTFPPSPIHFLTTFDMAGGIGLLEGASDVAVPSANLGAGVRQRNVGHSVYRVVGEKIHFLRCPWELNNSLLSAVSSALHLPMVPFGCTHMLVLSDLKIWRPSNKIFETLENWPV